MQRGNRILPFRIDEKLMDEVRIAVAESNKRRKESQITISDFIRTAIREKLSHRKRSKKKPTVDNFTCCRCDRVCRNTDLAWTSSGLFGEVEKCCVPCDLVV